MNAQPTTRRSTATAVLAALALASVPAAAPLLPSVQAVVSFDGRALSVPGVRVLSSLPSFGMQVVRADAAGLSRLAHLPGVRGIALDRAVRWDSSSDSGSGDGVLASRGLGGAAGKPGAGAGVRVAVIDTGISDTPALNRDSGRLIDAVDTSGGDAATGGVYPDGYGHGTFMADLIAGGSVPGVEGALGVAPGATVLNVRVAANDGTTTLSNVINGLQWVYDNAATVDVANLSLSKVGPDKTYGADPLNRALEFVRGAGVTVVVSAGNTPQTVGDPGFDPQALTVGAANLNKDEGQGEGKGQGKAVVASFSGSDVVDGVQKPDVVANGVRVLGLLPPSSVLAQDPATSHLDNGLFRGSGTSQAAAVTSGLAALVLAAHPDATPLQVKASLRCSAIDLHTKRAGAGLVRWSDKLCAGADGQALDGSGDASGESGFDASSWGASSWGASSWGASSWGASSWASDFWGAGDPGATR